MRQQTGGEEKEGRGQPAAGAGRQRGQEEVHPGEHEEHGDELGPGERAVFQHGRIEQEQHGQHRLRPRRIPAEAPREQPDGQEGERTGERAEDLEEGEIGAGHGEKDGGDRVGQTAGGPADAIAAIKGPVRAAGGGERATRGCNGRPNPRPSRRLSSCAPGRESPGTTRPRADKRQAGAARPDRAARRRTRGAAGPASPTQRTVAGRRRRPATATTSRGGPCGRAPAQADAGRCPRAG